MRRLVLGLVALLLTSASCEVHFNWSWNQPDHPKPTVASGKTVTVDRPIGAFDSLSLDGLGQLTLDATVPAGVVRVKADEAVLSQVKTTVEGTTLTLTEEGFSGPGSLQLEYRVAPPAHLKAVVLNGLGSINATAPLKTPDALEVTLNGLGRIGIDVDAPEVTLHQKGQGELAVGGTSQKAVTVVAEGLGRVDAGRLHTPRADVDSRGMGEVVVWANQSLRVRASGMGAVHFSGHPGQKDVETEGMTSVSSTD